MKLIGDTAVDEPEAKTAKADEKEKLKLVGLSDGEGASGAETLVGVEGRVATPLPVTPGSAFGGGAPVADNSNDKAGTGLPFLGLPPQGGNLGASRAGGSGETLINNRGLTNPTGSGTSSGGGRFGGGGGVRTVSQGTTTTGSSAKNDTTVNIDFNVSLVNSQSQDQYQLQKQKQSQSQDQSQDQSQSNGGNGNVIPEPASLIGLALGVPALIVVYRRRTRKTPPE